MTILVSDTSVLIDLERGELIASAFKLSATFAVPDVLYERELRDYGGEELVKLGLKVESLDGDGVALAMRYMQAQRRLTVPDGFALVLAKRNAWTLLTGDGPLRELAKAEGVSKNTIHRLWQDHQLKPHLTKSFKLSRDPRFLEKLTDVVGVYLTPPQNAVVLCVDEKSQIQALDRTQPGLPLKPGRCGTFTHDYERHGTTTLFAALHVLEGRVIGQCYPRHRHQEFLKFLRRLDEEFPGEVTLHLILDNYGTHGHERVRRWLAKHAFCAALHSDEFQLVEFD